ncbi:MAG: V-type ATPase subunit [Candidatus Pacebacteria bacterium]|nr:V-type ATPase subunit [Candidatus Paceibacterota bacterium]
MYEFATGVINVWEKRLLSINDQERMLKAPDRASAFIVLFDTDLGEIIAGNMQKNLEDIFLEDLKALKRKLSYILDDKELLESFLLLKFDAFNLKAFLKKKFLGDEAKKFKPFEFSLEPAENILTEKCLNPHVQKLVNEALRALNNNKASGYLINSQAIEAAVDRAYFNIKSTIAKKEKALLEMVALEIDVANLRSFLGKEIEPFLTGGNLTVSQIESLANRKEENISSNLKKFLEVLELSFLLDESQSHHTKATLEKKLDSYIAKKIFQKEKEKGSGIEKVLAFFQRKMNSYANIRLILFAKENGLSVSEIEGSLLPL